MNVNRADQPNRKRLLFSIELNIYLTEGTGAEMADYQQNQLAQAGQGTETGETENVTSLLQ